MDRDTALALLESNVKNNNLRKHCLACEAVLAALANHFDEDEHTWRLAGLLHELYYDDTADSPETHGHLAAKMLEEKGVDSHIVHAVLAHADKAPRESLLDKALWCTDPLTGLIVAAALIHPDKKLGSIDTHFVLNRFGEKHFARGANRDQIKACENELALPLDNFISTGLQAMQSISNDLGL